MKQGKNRYYRRSRLQTRLFCRVVRAFSLDLTASQSARLTGVSIRSVNDIYLKIRRRLDEACRSHCPLTPFRGQVEVDESYFGPRRVRGKRGRGAGGKTIVFGIFKRNGWVYTEIVPDCRQKTLQKAIRGQVSLSSVIHSDGWRGYDGLVDVGYEKHLRVEHGANQFADDKTHINGIESFWSFAKLRLSKFKGVPRHTFHLHLKETEFRFNHRRDNLYRVLLNLLRRQPL